MRQWVLWFPIPLRSVFAVHPELITPVLRIIHRAIRIMRLLTRLGHLIEEDGIVYLAPGDLQRAAATEKRGCLLWVGCRMLLMR